MTATNNIVGLVEWNAWILTLYRSSAEIHNRTSGHRGKWIDELSLSRDNIVDDVAVVQAGNWTLDTFTMVVRPDRQKARRHRNTQRYKQRRGNIHVSVVLFFISSIVVPIQQRMSQHDNGVTSQGPLFPL